MFEMRIDKSPIVPLSFTLLSVFRILEGVIMDFLTEVLPAPRHHECMTITNTNRRGILLILCECSRRIANSLLLIFTFLDQNQIMYMT